MTIDKIIKILERMTTIPDDKYSYEDIESAFHTTISILSELPKIIEQLESCNYMCEAGTLENNVGFLRLKQIMGS